MVENKQNKPLSEVKCPECHAPLKKRRTRNPDTCEMVCGGCGQMFDMCNSETRDQLPPLLQKSEGSKVKAASVKP